MDESSFLKIGLKDSEDVGVINRFLYVWDTRNSLLSKMDISLLLYWINLKLYQFNLQYPRFNVITS